MLIVLDGTNLIRRLYHAGGTGSITKTADRLHRQYGGEVVVAWDSKHPYWRHLLFPDYKAQRVGDPRAEEFVRAAAREARSGGLRGFYAEGMEADDIAATLVARSDEESIVVTSDKDWCQLLADGARWLAPERGGFEERDEAWVWKRFGIGPGMWPDFVALAGDPSDGIPGVRGMGPIRATKALLEHGTAEAYAESLSVNGYNPVIDQVRIFKQIATLRTDAALQGV